MVRLREEDRGQVSDVNEVLVNTPQGQVMQAKNLVDVQTQTGPTQIERKNQERITRVNAQNETTLSEAVAAVQQRITQVNVPPDFSMGFGAEVEEQARSFGQLQLMLILAIVLVYAVMASQYESLRDPFIIMFSVPLAAIGVVLAFTADQHTVQSAGVHRRDHAGRHRREQCDPAGRLHEHPPPARRASPSGGRRACGTHASATRF